jgi:ribonuclease HI
MARDITHRILDAAKASIPHSKTFKGKRKLPYWNDELKNKIIERKKNIRLYKNTLNAETRDKITSLSNEIRELMQRCKTESWRQYTTTINHKASTKEVYDKMRALNGKTKNTEIRKLTNKDGTQTTNQVEIANIIKDTFEFIYSDDNLNTTLKSIKQQSNIQLQITTDINNEPYNDNITMKEFEESLAQTKGSSPGKDKIHYDMLKYLTQKGKQTLIQLYNKILDEGLPKQWKHSLIVPIKKPGKDPRNPTSYRPIALTSCLCKLLEKIINRRLQWTIENKNLLNKYQSGFTKGKSTIDNITYFVDEIQKGFTKQEQTTALFIDLKNAYDRVWMHKVIENMERLGFKGRILTFINNFLYDRTFNIQLGNIESNIGYMQNGIPQGSVLSCTLFNIVFDDVLNNIEASTKFCAYADDLLLFHKGKDSKSLEENIQKTLRETNKQMNKNGLEISIDKTKMMHFTQQKNKNIQTPRITLNGENIECVKNYKFLGVIFNEKLKWTEQINLMYNKTIKNTNLIKMLSNTTYGAERQTLLKIHESLTTSIHNYSSLILTKLTKNDERKINTVHIRCLRYAIGAFVTTPNTSTQTEAGVLPLKHQRKVQLLKYACKIKSNINHILHDSLEDDTKDEKYSKLTNPPITYIMRRELQQIDINKKTNFISSQQLKYPPWRKSKFKINLSMTQFDKNKNSHIIILKTFNEQVDKYIKQGYEVIYTDGSKTEHGYGAAVVTQNRIYTYKCHKYSTVYTTEIFALSKALEHRCTNKTLICTDSLSVVKAIKNSQTKNLMIQQILDKLREPENETTIFWIPSHVGIEGNEKVDEKAKKATKSRLYANYKISTEDVTKHIKNHAKEIWKQEWEGEIEKGNKLGNIKKTINKWQNINNYNRKDQIVITRLRLGHSRLTHLHLINKSNPPKCTCDLHITIKHIFECTNYKTAIDRYKINYHSLGHDNTDETDKIIDFLKETQLYDQI